MIIAWLPEAIRSRDEHLQHLAQESIQATRDVAERLRGQVRRLVQFPQLGVIGRKRGTRELVILRTSLIVVYRVRPKLKRVEILRVLHSSQQWPPA